jgi:hypothetical protein
VVTAGAPVLLAVGDLGPSAVAVDGDLDVPRPGAVGPGVDAPLNPDVVRDSGSDRSGTEIEVSRAPGTVSAAIARASAIETLRPSTAIEWNPSSSGRSAAGPPGRRAAADERGRRAEEGHGAAGPKPGCSSRTTATARSGGIGLSVGVAR